MMFIISKFINKPIWISCDQVVNLLYQNHHNDAFSYGNLQVFNGLERELEFTCKYSEKNKIND